MKSEIELDELFKRKVPKTMFSFQSWIKESVYILWIKVILTELWPYSHSQLLWTVGASRFEWNMSCWRKGKRRRQKYSFLVNYPFNSESYYDARMVSTTADGTQDNR